MLTSEISDEKAAVRMYKCDLVSVRMSACQLVSLSEFQHVGFGVSEQIIRMSSCRC